MRFAFLCPFVLQSSSIMSSSHDGSVAARVDIPPAEGESLAELAEHSREQQQAEHVRIAQHAEDFGPAAVGNAHRGTGGLLHQHLLLTYSQCEAPLSFAPRYDRPQSCGAWSRWSQGDTRQRWTPPPRVSAKKAGAVEFGTLSHLCGKVEAIDRTSGR